MLAMLGIALGGLGILAIACVIGLVVSGCSGSEDEVKKPDAAPPEPSQDPFAKNPQFPQVEPDSYVAYTYLWRDDIKKAQIDNWHRKASIYFGTTDQLYKAIDEDDKVKEKAGEYTNAVKGFFENHYSAPADKSQQGLLVLLAGIAPISVDESIVFGALDAMAATSTEEKFFADLMKAFYHFNKAVEHADKRYIEPNGFKMSPEQKEDARKHLKKMAEILKKFEDMDGPALNKALTHQQQELLDFLRGSAEKYEKTLVKSGRIVDPCKENPNDPRCKGGGTRESIIPG